jgi:hypothetical protein
MILQAVEAGGAAGSPGGSPGLRVLEGSRTTAAHGGSAGGGGGTNRFEKPVIG